MLAFINGIGIGPHRLMAQYSEISSEEACDLLPISDKSALDRSSKDLEERDGAYLLSGPQCATVIFKFCVGAGWFSLPSAFQYSGVLVGVVWIFMCGALTTYGMQRLVQTSWEVARRNGTESAYFGDIGEACGRLFSERCGLILRWMVNIIISITALGLACPLVLFLADIWKQAFEEQNIVQLDISIWILIVLILIFPSIFVRKPVFLAWFSVVANTSLFLTVVAVFVNIFRTTSDWKVDNTVKWSKLPLTFGITLYAFEIAPFILSVENKTKKPKQLPLVINVVMLGVSFMYAVLGSFGYISCFPDCQDSIVLNLPDLWYYSVAKILLGFATLCGLVFVSFIVYDAIEPILEALVPENRFYVVALLFRMLVITFSAAISACVPQLGNVISFCGSFVAISAGFLLPAATHTLLLYKQLSRFTIAANIIFSFCGIFILIAGVYTSVSEIISDY